MPTTITTKAKTQENCSFDKKKKKNKRKTQPLRDVSNFEVDFVLAQIMTRFKYSYNRKKV